MKILTHPAMLALGAATLCLLAMIGPLVSPSHNTVYHLSGSALSIFVPVLINLGLVWFALTILLWFTRRSRWLQAVVWTSFIVLLPWIILKDWFVLAKEAIPNWIRSLGLLSPIIICAIVFLALRPSFRPLFLKIQHFSELLLGFASISALLVICQLLWFAWQARDLNLLPPFHQHSAVAESSMKPRIVWIVLDELSYQQVYEQRFPGLQLPAFDQLTNQSTIFTHASPAGVFTEIILPSLMTGLPVDQIRASANGRQLFLHNSKDDAWTPFEPHQTIFQDALDAGYSTAVAGWYNPYCRILPQVLDNCVWSSYGSLAGGMYPGQPIAWNTRQFALSHLDPLLSRLSPGDQPPQDLIQVAQFHQMDYRDLLTAADKLLTKPSANFIFLHMPVPHPIGIYDRKKMALTTSRSSYIDNLALADQYLAHVRLVLEQRGEWNSATIVVMGDHSWRTKLWSWTEVWTREDKVASHGGQFDDRPAYIVKLPNQQKPARIEDRFDAVRTRVLLDGIITNRIKTPEDLAAWVRK
jgi:Sulfatase